MRGFLFASTPAMNGMRSIFKPAFGLATSAGYSKLFLPLWYMCMHRFICRSDMLDRLRSCFAKVPHRRSKKVR